MNSDRIKEIQQQTAYPESRSVAGALEQVWNECAQEASKLLAESDAEYNSRTNHLIEGHAAQIDWLRTRAEAAERERDEAYAAGQRDFQKRVAKRLDDLAMEQKSWHNLCAASVIRMEANAVRSLPIKERP